MEYCPIPIGPPFGESPVSVHAALMYPALGEAMMAKSGMTATQMMARSVLANAASALGAHPARAARPGRVVGSMGY